MVVEVPVASPVAGFVAGAAGSPVTGSIEGAAGSPVAGFVEVLLGGGGLVGVVDCANAGEAANKADAATDMMNLRIVNFLLQPTRDQYALL